jgi:hypothetical protein
MGLLVSGMGCTGAHMITKSVKSEIFEQNDEEILDNGLCQISNSPTSLHLFSHLSLTERKWIHHRNPLPYIYTSKFKKC